MKGTLAIGSSVLLFAALAFAHGNEQHIMGTIAAISGDTITVQALDKQSRVVYLSDKTKFTKPGAAATLDDLKIGDRVVIHARKQGDKLVAHTVALGVANANEQQRHLKDSHANADHKQ